MTEPHHAPAAGGLPASSSGDAPTSRGEWRGYLCVALAAATWGTWSLFLRAAEQREPVSPALEVTLVFATMSLVPLPFFARELLRTPRPMRAWLLVVAVGVTDALNCYFFFEAMQTTSLAVAVLSHYLAPLLVAVSAPWVLRETRHPATWTALLLSSAGLALLVRPWQPSSGSVGTGALLGSLSAVFYAATLLNNKYLQRYFQPGELLAVHSVPATLLLALLVPAGGFSIHRETALTLVLGSCLLGVFAGLLFLRGLRAIPASRAAVLTLLEPLVSVALGVLVWKESPGVTGIPGAILLLLGAYVVTRAAPSKPGLCQEPSA